MDAALARRQDEAVLAQAIELIVGDPHRRELTNGEAAVLTGCERGERREIHRSLLGSWPG
jgi:hypothetical protein